MKNIKLAALAIALVGIFGAGNALAVNTATLDVTANVIEACTFDSNGGTLAFGALDALTPVAIGPITPDTQPFFTCTNGTTYTISDDAAANPLDNTSNTDTIVYTLAYTNAGTADGTSTALDVAGSITAAAYTGASVGNYLATVTFTITP